MSQRKASFRVRLVHFALALLLMAGSHGCASKSLDTPGRPGTPGVRFVKDFGAKGDGVVKDTQAVQKAIDFCADHGGGTVWFSPGTYLCGSLHMKSRVGLWLDYGATIKGSKMNADYDPPEKREFKNAADSETSFFHYALIWGENVEHVGIAGAGTIDSNRKARGGPKAIALKKCRFVDIRGIHILNIPNYPISLLGTDNVNIDGVTILNGFADGIDPDACHNVRIANCHIESVDDSIVPKASFSLGERRSTENVTVTNCYLATACNNFKLGTESGGDFKRIAVSNCVMVGLKSRRPASAGIAIETVDGANIDGVVVSNITMVDVRAPIFIRLGNRGRDMPTPVAGSLKNVCISDVVATDASLTSSITGIPGSRVEGVTLSNIRIAYKGGGAYCALDQAVPEKITQYPDADMFDALPGYGLYCRHVKSLTLENVQLLFNEGFWRVPEKKGSKIKWNGETGNPEPNAPGRPGPALVCDDVTDLSISGLVARATAEDPVIALNNARETLINGCRAPQGTCVFLQVSGADSSKINLTGNALADARKPIEIKQDAPGNAVQNER